MASPQLLEDSLFGKIEVYKFTQQCRKCHRGVEV